MLFLRYLQLITTLMLFKQFPLVNTRNTIIYVSRQKHPRAICTFIFQFLLCLTVDNKRITGHNLNNFVLYKNYSEYCYCNSFFYIFSRTIHDLTDNSILLKLVLKLVLKFAYKINLSSTLSCCRIRYICK